MDTLSLYIHIPFCQAKCVYCDFNSYAGLDSLFGDYTAALTCEMLVAARAQVRTIYVGGGTPTVLPLEHLAQILEAALHSFSVDAEAEITLEANPGTLDPGNLARLRSLGLNRLSLGVQSFDEQELSMLGRIHTTAEAHQAIQAARALGIDNISLDLIYGLPRQPLTTWRTTLEEALSQQPEHLSLYALTVEEGTPLDRLIAQGTLPGPDPDLAAEMYEYAQDALCAAGYHHYEISNWARAPRLRCQHNLVYWRNEPYLGAGAGAHSWVGGRRWANVATPGEYVARLATGRPYLDSEETIDLNLEMAETMILGLRLVDEGVEFARFQARFGVDLRQHYADELAELQVLNLIATDSDRVKLTRWGRLLGNQVFLRFLPD
jgi:oxygen-independent coproporphyrinogen-3 oxidase